MPKAIHCKAIQLHFLLSPSVTSCHLPRQIEAFLRRVEDATPYVEVFFRREQAHRPTFEVFHVVEQRFIVLSMFHFSFALVEGH